MAKPKPSILVPFIAPESNWGVPGSLQVYTHESPGEQLTYGPKTEWRRNEPWVASLRLDNFERGRSAARYVWKDAKDATFPMFLVDLLTLATTRGISSGGWVRDATWIVHKRGVNYGIALHVEQP